MEVPAIKFTQVAPLINNLPEPKQTEEIRPMEKFDQGWGSILYRTRLPEDVKAGTILKITEQHGGHRSLPTGNCWGVWTAVAESRS